MYLCTYITYITLNSFNFEQFYLLVMSFRMKRKKVITVRRITITEVPLDNFEKFNYMKGCYLWYLFLEHYERRNISSAKSVINLLNFISLFLKPFGFPSK